MSLVTNISNLFYTEMIFHFIDYNSKVIQQKKRSGDGGQFW